MTPEEFAAQTGLSLEEAEMVLSARKAKEQESGKTFSAGNQSRLARALDILRGTERRVGVKPYEESK